MKKKYLYYITAVIVVIGVLVVGWNLDNTPEAEPVTEEYILEIQETEEKQTPEENQIPKEKEPVVSKQEKPKLSFSNSEKVPVDVVSEEIIEEEIHTTICSLTVDLSDVLKNLECLDESKRKLITEDGIIFSMENIEFTEGESVFDILKRELKKSGIPVEFSLTPVYNSVYIEGINNIYEFDCGERSGWKYSVNGTFPPVSCSDYKLNNGDKIKFVYKVKGY